MEFERVTRRSTIAAMAGIGTVGLSGCSNILGDSGSSGNTIVIGGASSDSSAYQLAVIYAEAINEETDDYEIDVRPMGSTQGMEALAQGDADFSQAPLLSAYDINNEIGVYSDSPVPHKVQQVWSQYWFASGLLFAANSGIESISDLEGKSISPAPAGSTVRQLWTAALEEQIDIDSVDMPSFQYTQQGEGIDSGQIDGAQLGVIQTGEDPEDPESWLIPSSNSEGFQAASVDLVLHHFTDSERDTIDSTDRVVGSVYPNEITKAQTLADVGNRTAEYWLESPYQTFTAEHVDDQVVRDILEIIWNLRDEISEKHAFAGTWGNGEVFQRTPDTVAVHPEAEAFYESV